MFVYLFLFILSGCFEMEELVDFSKKPFLESNREYNYVVYFRNFYVHENFSSVNLKILKNKKIYNSNIKLGDLKNKIFYECSLFASDYEIKITNLPSRRFLDCYIERFYYDADKSKIVIVATVKFAGKITTFHVSKNIKHKEDYQEIFPILAESIVQFVSLAIKNNYKSIVFN